MPVVVILTAIALTLYLFYRWCRQVGPVRTQAMLKRLGYIAGGLLALVILLRSGPLAALLTPIVLPAAIMWLRHRARTRPPTTTGGETVNDGTQSTIETRYFAMTLDHQSGRMDGRVTSGHFTGRELADMAVGDLAALWHECSTDAQSIAVLEAYLEHSRPGWRDQEGFAGASDDTSEHSARTAAAMDRAEAYAILGLEPDASADSIRSAHKRLMQRLHPDHGGSDYLASRINQAKDLLLKDG